MFSTPASRRKAIVAAVATLALALVGAGGVSAFVSSSATVPIVPASSPSAQKAADIQSIINVWYAYAANLDSGNDKGVAALMTPTGGYTMQQDSQTMAPAACQPEPGSTTPCIASGGCEALGFNGIQVFLSHYMKGDVDEPFSFATQHQLMSPVVTIAPDAQTAQLYVYWNGGRYINTFVRTPDGWKVQWERIVWNSSNFECYGDWSSDNTAGILGTDLYFLQLPVAGPQIPVARRNDPSLVRANRYVQAALDQVNDGNDSAACQPINGLTKEVPRDSGLNAGYRNYLETIAARFLADDSCDGLTPPDHTQSTGAWAASTAWEGYELSAGPGAMPQPPTIPPFSTVSGSL